MKMGYKPLLIFMIIFFYLKNIILTYEGIISTTVKNCILEIIINKLRVKCIPFFFEERCLYLLAALSTKPQQSLELKKHKIHI